MPCLLKFVVDIPSGNEALTAWSNVTRRNGKARPIAGLVGFSANMDSGKKVKCFTISRFISNDMYKMGAEAA